MSKTIPELPRLITSRSRCRCRRKRRTKT